MKVNVGLITGSIEVNGSMVIDSRGTHTIESEAVVIKALEEGTQFKLVMLEGEGTLHSEEHIGVLSSDNSAIVLAGDASLT